MRLLISLSVTWLTFTLVLGVVGSRLLRSLQHEQENLAMVTSAALAAAVCENTDWRVPWESDPRWNEMEKRWQVDVVPLAKSDALNLVKFDDTSVEANRWNALPSGLWEIRRAVAIAGRGAEAIAGISVTRVVDFGHSSRLWWTLWSVTLVFGGTAIVLTGLTRHSYQQRRLTALKIWVEAANDIPDVHRAQLPENLIDNNLSDDGELSVQLSILRESINRWLADLQSELQRNELVLGNMQEGVLAVDDKARVLLANAAVTRLLGLSTENYLYRSLVEVIRTPRIVAIIERVLGSSTPQEESFEHGRHQLSLRVLVRPVPLGNDRVGALMTVRDETLIKRIESVRRDFVTNASHELKTPLAAIRAYAETLQMGATDDPEATQTFLSGILTQADRINGLITGMLQLARVQSGSAMLKQARFELQSEIEGCLDAAEVMAKAKQITLEKVLPSAPLYMNSDAEAVQTVVSNLLSNAVRYTPSGGHVSLHLTASESAITIRVQDTGIGIDKEELARIFERFYRVERARAADTGGTGLGLSIVKHLLQALGGTITVTSEPHQGSCFEVHLPIKPA